ncbi:MAG TPA: VCBS repeat-containing protein, partial [Rubricoccaceae bacterium]|nr:VCBS repeat-containing protein [Rubricoccaceae bacterium]
MRNHYALSLLAASLLAAGAPLAQPAFSLVSANFPAQRGHAAVAPADYDGDGDFDLLAIRQAVYSVDPMMRPVLYRNDSVSTAGVFLFTEVPFPASPYPAQETTADPDGETVSWSDYDNDGDVDALVATPFYSGIYRNDDSTFVEAVVLPPYSEFIGGAFDSRSAVWTDYDNDGDGDLFLSERFEAEITVDSTRLVLYRNDAGSFTPADTTFPFYAGALHLTTGDLEGDGDLDLLYHDVGWHCGGPVGPPEGEECVVFYENANGAFVPDSLSFPIAIHGSASDLADYDGDGDLDMLLVTELGRDQYPPDPYSAALLYRNEDGVFIADTLEFEISGEREFNRTKGAAWADYDDDGDLDAVVVGTVMPGQDGLAILFANTNGTLTHTAEIPTVDFFGTVAWFDLDGDGDLDYLTSGYLSGPT